MHSLFNFFYTAPILFSYMLGSFLILLFLRKTLFKKPSRALLLHAIFFGFSVFIIIGGGGVQNDAYKRLNQFIALEQNGELETAKQNPQEYDSMLQIDLKQFNNSTEFKNYIESHDPFIDRSEATIIGWLFILAAEIVLLFV